MSSQITSLLQTEQLVAPPVSFKEKAHIKSEAEYEALWRFSVEEPEAFWAEQAKTYITWMKPWDRVFQREESFHLSWFPGAKLNLSANCLDRHLQDKAEKTALIWEGEPEGEIKTFTFSDLHREVSRAANALKSIGVTKTDVVTLYMPMLPELVIAMLACTRIGAMHHVVFAGFSSESLSERMNHCQSKFVITADFGFRKGKILPTKKTVDQALESSPQVTHVLVVQRSPQTRLSRSEPTHLHPGRDLDWYDLIEKQSPDCAPEALDAEHPLFLLYTSGSTGKPKGIVHSTAGYLLQTTLSAHLVFDLKNDDRFWCTADMGWITGHSYAVYGPLSNGVSTFIYEGAPSEPDWGRFWRMIQRHRLTHFYTAPTAIRTFMKQGRDWIDQSDLSSLRLIGSVGEPINPEVWNWYHDVVGGKRCPLVDTWWQTETGSMMITTLPGAMACKPGSAGKPFFGVNPQIVDEKGQVVSENTRGAYLILKGFWPSLMRTLYKDHDRFISQYFSKIPETYFTGDGARKDKDGYFWILGRIDDVVNVSGHRLSTMEIESALVSHPAVAEASVVGKRDEIRGEALVCFVSLKNQVVASSELNAELKNHVSKKIGSLARPDELHFMDLLPKTRSGKIMRRVLRSLANGEQLTQDLSTLEDKESWEAL
ncbi:MAG: acetate--CoA ligase [Oligoflexales bacterium]|nr:acetate--CoA ligase [Oligoflexales bacterium]